MVDNNYEHDYVFDWTKSLKVKLKDILPEIKYTDNINIQDNKVEENNKIFPTTETNYTSNIQINNNNINLNTEEFKNKGKMIILFLNKLLYR